MPAFFNGFLLSYSGMLLALYLVALAGAFDGVMAGLGIGWLIGVNVAEGAVDEAEEELAHLTQGGNLAEAH